MNKTLQAAMLRSVGRYVRGLFEPHEARVKAVEQRIESLPEIVQRAAAALPPAKDGASVTLDDVRPLVSEAVKGIELPQVAPGPTAEEIGAIVRDAVAALPAPKDGKDGASTDEIREMVADAIKAMPAPKDGQSVTVQQVVDALSPVVDQKIATWALEFERRAQGVLERAVDRMPKPRDGKDGADGLGFDDLQVSFDGERSVVLRFVRGETVKEFPLTLPAVIDRGVFKEGADYVRGDGVTWGGSFWIAQGETKSKPDAASGGWRLAVKRGRDGKDGRDGIDKASPLRVLAASGGVG